MKFKIKILAISLILLCCLMGAASAADDVSMDAVDASVDDAVAVDTVSEDISDSAIADENPVEAVSDDSIIEETSEETQTDEISEESADVDSEPTRTTITNWADLKTACGQTSAQTIDLSGVITATDSITIKNSVTITGSSSGYITGGSSSYAPFVCSQSGLTTTFKNIQFKNMNVLHLCQFSGTNKFENCTFINITTGTGKNSVLYNTYGFMNVTGCNFTNCTTGYGTITNYFFIPSAVTMSVSNCKFENNTASSEPGAINNCGILNVTNSEFNYNSAALWAGAIHTHSNAKTIIKNSSFKGNLAGWNGGALYTYSTLLVYNSTFEDNNCTTDSGGGAIGAYSYGSTYNVTIDSCNFTNNRNMATNGRGGAIGTLNAGNLTVCYSNFINNHADIGQAIAAVTYTIQYCTNCTNCNCTNCPNCTNCTHNVSNGTPHLQIFNNTFTNHTGSGDTVVISGNDYLFENNTFVNSVQNTHYGDNNDYGSKAALNLDMSKALKANLKSSNPLLDDDGYDIRYASNNEELQQAFSSSCAANTKIYISDGTYDVSNAYFNPNPGVNIIIIGQSMGNTILNTFCSELNQGETGTITLINLTFNEIVTNVETDFINCTFLCTMDISKQITDQYFYPEYGNVWDPSLDNYGMKKTYLSNFENCIFKNINTEGPAYSIYKFGLAKFTDCTFENITADSIIYKSGEYYDADGIYFTDCTFKNIDVKGIVDYPAGTVIGTDEDSRLRIEGSTFDFAASTDVLTVGEHNYINSTQSRADSNLTIDIDGDNLVISLTDMEGNHIADVDEINVLVNEESIPCQMENGVATLNISDLSGKVTFSAAFEGNANYKESSASLSTYIIVNNITVEVPVEVPVYINQTATSIVASALTTTAKVAKTLSITLKDASGKVLASKAVQVTVNGKTSTVTTDKNGVAKVNVNYANAGTYYYTLSFLGDNDYKASMKAVKVTVNKQATKATFAKKTFKVKAKTKKVSFTLKDAKGKAIKGKKITFTVNKKTYTANTNAKGIATVKVKLTKKGKYTAVAKFAGDNTYKAISKKAVITIK